MQHWYVCRAVPVVAPISSYFISLSLSFCHLCRTYVSTVSIHRVGHDLPWMFTDFNCFWSPPPTVGHPRHLDQKSSAAACRVHGVHSIASLLFLTCRVPTCAHLSHLCAPSDLAWVNSVIVDMPAVKRRAETMGTKRTVKKEWQAAWLLRAASCIDLTTLSG